MSVGPFYRVELTIGSLPTWVVRQGDDPDPAAGSWVLDQLRIGWNTGELVPSFVQNTGSVSIRAVNARSVADKATPGTPVSIRVKRQDSAVGSGLGLVARFDGRLGEGLAAPDARGGTVFTFPLVGAEADAGELVIGAEPWPEEPAADRLARIFAAAGQVLDTIEGTLPADFIYAALDVDRRSMWDVLEDHLRQLVGAPASNYSTPGWARFYLARYGTSGSDARWRLAVWRERVEFPVIGWPYLWTRLPYDPAAPGSGNVVTIRRQEGHRQLIDASRIDLSSVTWRSGKESAAVDTVDVTGPAGTVRVTNNAGRNVVRTIESQLTTTAAAGKLAAMYLPDPAVSAVWDIDALTYFPASLDALPFGLPDTGLVITGLPAAQNLGQLDYYAGQLSSHQLVIAGQRVALQLGIRRGMPRQSLDDPAAMPCSAFTYDAGTPAFGETTYRPNMMGTPHIDPSLTYFDLRMAGR